MVLLALSLQDQVEKYGTYVGIAAFFGLAVLSLLYFAQAREVKRLREWAGRAPERAAELEQAVIEHAEETRRAATPVPASQPVAAAPQAAVNGAVTLKPEEVAALAFARAAGVREPHEPRPHPAPAAAVAAPAATSVATAEPPAPAPVLAPTTNGGSAGAAPPPVTPAARRSEPAPLPPRRPPLPSRRPAPPPRRESNSRAVALSVVAGVLVLAAAAFGFTFLTGGDEEPPPPNRIPPAPTEEAGTEAPARPKAPTKETALVAVYNGIGATGLATRFKEQLVEEGYPEKNLGVGDVPPEQQGRQTSIVMYDRGAKAAAEGVATALDIPDVQPIDDAAQGLSDAGQKDWDVVVIVGFDKSQ